MKGIRPNALIGYTLAAATAPPQFRPPGWPEWLAAGVEITLRVREGAQRRWETKTGRVLAVGEDMILVDLGRYRCTWTRADWWSRLVVLIGPDGTPVLPSKPPGLGAIGRHTEKHPKRLPLAGPWATLMPKGISLNKAASQTFAQAGIKRVKVGTEGDMLLILPDAGGYTLSAKRKDSSWQYQLGSPALTRRLLEAGFAYGRYRLEPYRDGFAGRWVEGAWGRPGGIVREVER